MDIKLRFTIPIPEGLIETLDIDEDTVLEAFITDGKLIVNTLDDEDFDDFVCDGDCDDCFLCDDDTEDEIDDFDYADECPSGEFDCENCEFFCKHCGACNYDD